MRRRILSCESLESRLAMAVVGLDPAFGIAGQATAGFSENTSSGTTASDVAVQPDGKIVSAGDRTLLRMLDNGQLDRQFGAEGLVGLAFDCRALTLQNDGKIVLVGSVNGTESIIARYQTDGRIDTTFGNSGFVSFDFTEEYEYASAVAIDWVGRIVFTGDAHGPLTVGRLASDGSLDPSFGNNGLLIRDMGGWISAQDVALQSNGGVVIAGNNMSVQNLSVYRLHPNGTLDANFGVFGVSAVDFELPPAFLWEERGASVEIQSDGRIVAMCEYDAKWLGLVRLNANGSIDTSFSDNGKLEIVADFSTVVIDMKIHTDGRIFAMSSFRTYAVLPNGTLDDTFGFFPYRDLLAGGNPIDHGMVLSEDGILMVGNYTSWQDQKMLFHRGLFNGAMDTSFGQGGKLHLLSGPSRDVSSDSTLQADGKLLMAGKTIENLGITRYQTNGSLDPSFGQGGKVTMEPLPSYFLDSVASVDVVRNGQIIVAANFRKRDLTDANVFLLRLNANGSLDTTFGVDGYQMLDLGASEYASDLLIQPNGKMVVAVNRFSTGWNAALFRCNADGTLDTSFSHDGSLQMATNGSKFAKILLQPDGRILAGGHLSFGQNVPFALLARFMPNGAPDLSFGTNSVIIERKGAIDIVTDIDLGADGSIYATGGNMTIQKYSTVGVRDTSFQWAPPNMVVPFDFRTEIRSGYNMQLILRPEGYLMSGIFGDRSVVLAFRTDGTLDERFNGSGKWLATSSTPGNVQINRIFLQPDGKLLATGSITETETYSTDTDFVAYRFNAHSTPLVTTTVSRNSAGQIELSDLWQHSDKWRFGTTATSLIITDMSADRRVKFSVIGLPEITGDDTKQIVIPLSLLQASGQPLIVNSFAGDDTFTFSDQFNAPTFGLSLRGGFGNDTISMSNQSVPINWILSSATSGSLRPLGRTPIRFAGIDKMLGGTNSDAFRLVYQGSSDRLVIDGGGGALDSIQLQADQDMSVSNNAWPGDSQTLIVGIDQPQYYSMQGIEKATIISGASDNRIDFSKATWALTLRAGAGNDTIFASQAPSLLYGEAGNDIIYGSVSVDRVFGGEGNDVIIGNLGDDQLFGEAGNDILIGNQGGDLMYGGTGQDLFIGGFCSVIESLTSSNLGRQVVNAWFSTSSYANRVHQLSVLGIGPDRVKLTAGSTVIDDNEVDTFFGEDDLDWFFVNALQELNVAPRGLRDAQPSETVT
ncbi:MAG: hypothetical protein IT423_20275 [Pirellulaceae bacterium]|nr:hypothetical protein [Pirellulaceae bacterium]